MFCAKPRSKAQTAFLHIATVSSDHSYPTHSRAASMLPRSIAVSKLQGGTPRSAILLLTAVPIATADEALLSQSRSSWIMYLVEQLSGSCLLTKSEDNSNEALCNFT